MVARAATLNGIVGTHASPAYRDGFLSALDRHDGVTLTRLAHDMTSCGNPLPSVTCVQLGIPIGSTYGFAARRIVSNGTEGWIVRKPAAAPLVATETAPVAPDVAVVAEAPASDTADARPA